MNLFLDTNIWLGLYHAPQEELDGLARLSAGIAEGGITLFLTEQVVDELERNREKVVAEGVRLLLEDPFEEPLPAIGRGCPEHGEVEEAIRAYQEAKARLIERLAADTAARNLPADRLLAGLFPKARLLAVTDEIFERARRRFDRGNPPGKEGSYGDALHWECLLAGVPDGEGLAFVTADRDFRSQLDERALAPFLAAEWRRRKGSEVTFFRRLSTFLVSLPDGAPR
ncbi:MAG TPA: PIN domain-containing protein [Thermoanaerobaculia bacterium]|nr:PIN domain-containing protein [Thermoanaerobaculia bacterium]